MSEATATSAFETQSHAYSILKGKLGANGMEMLDGQLTVWQELNDREPASPLRDSLAAGDTTLPAGTLLHNAGFDPEVLAGIAERGIISGELLGVAEDSETHGCADFFKVPDKMTAGDYISYATEPVIEGSARASRGERMLTRGITFIVDPHTEGVGPLLARDGYTDTDMGAFISPPGKAFQSGYGSDFGWYAKGINSWYISKSTLAR